MTFDPSAARSGTILSDNPNYPAVWICYINGIEVPILGFNITSGIWQPPQFEIYLHPDPALQRLGAEDRVPVQIFYMDFWYDPDHPEFRMLVDGEIIGYRSKKMVGQRVMSFSCMSHVRIFEKLYFFFMNTVDDIVAAQSPEVRTQGFTQEGLFYPYSLFHNGLFVQRGTGSSTELDNQDADRPDQESFVKTPFEIAYNVVKGIIAAAPAVPDNKRTLPMMNFFARYVRKTRFHHRFVRLPLLEDVAAVNDRKGVFPIFAAVRSDEALAAMQHQVASRIGNSGSIWDMFKQIFGLVYMEFVSMANPPAVLTNLDGEILGPVRSSGALVELRGNASGREVREGQQSSHHVGQNPLQPIRLAQCFVKPQFMFGQPPSCNVIMPSMLDDWSYGEDYDQPTRMYVSDTVMSRLMRSQGANREFMLHALTVAYPDEADAVMHQRVAGEDPHSAEPRGTGKNLLIWPEEVFKGPVTAKMELPSWFQTLMQFRNSQTGAGSGNSVQRNVGAPAAQNATPRNPGAGGTSPTGPSGTPTQQLAGRGVTPATAASLARSPFIPATIPSRGQPGTPVQGDHGSGRSYLNGTPGVFASGYRSRVVARWNGEIGRVIRAMVPIFFGSSVPPEIFMGFSAGAEINENTTRARRSQRFHELGLFGCPAGLRDRPAPDPDPHRPYSSWAALASTPDVRRAIAAVEGTERNATLVEGAWTSLVDQVAVGLANLRRDRDGAATLLSRVGIRTATDASQWSTIITLMAWTTGPGGVQRAFSHPAIRQVVAAASPANRWGVAIRALAQAGAAGTISPEVAKSYRRNRFFGVIRTLQKIETAIVLARSVGGNVAWFEDGLGTDRVGLHDIIARLAYIRMPGQDLIGRTTQTPGPEEQTDVTTQRVVLPAESLRQVVRTVTGNVTPPGEVGASGTADRGASDSAPTTTVHETATTLGENLTEDETFQELFRLYAQYEFLRQRYMMRNGAAMMNFNPYPVPGFPTVVFDRAPTKEHAVAYMATVNQMAMAGSGNSGQIKTSTTMTCVRVLAEFLNDVRTDCERFAQRVTSAPAEIIPEIRNVIQNEEQAEIFYQKLFYGGRRAANLPAAFHFTRALGYARGLNAEEIRIDATETEEAPTDAPAPTEASGVDAAPAEVRTVRQVTHNLDPNEEIVPLPNTIYADAFDNYHIAMQLAARNVCSLHEFIRFWHGGTAVGDLLASHDVEGPEDQFAYQNVVERDVTAESATGRLRVGQAQRFSAVYYTRIFRLRPGPGRPLNEAERGYTEGDNATVSTSTSGVPADYPQTRADWDKILLEYRLTARTRVAPRT